MTDRVDSITHSESGFVFRAETERESGWLGGHCWPDIQQASSSARMLMVLGEGSPRSQGGGERSQERRAGSPRTQALQLSLASASLSGSKRRNSGTRVLVLTGGLGDFT